MQNLLILIVALVIAIVIVNAASRSITVFEYERGLKYNRGRFSKLLRPGQYRIFVYDTQIIKVDLRPRFVTIPSQEVLSADNIALKISLVASYEVIDPYIAINRVENYQQSLYLVLQLALRELTSAKTIDQVLEQRSLLANEITGLSVSQIEAFGVKLISVGIKDIMLPGDLKQIFAQVIKAQKEGQAALEKARSETAILRNLANAAKLVEENPALMHLRLLQSLSESSGHTVVLGQPPLHS